MPESSFKQPKIAAEFETMGQFNEEINEVGYARYNYKELQEREAELTKMIEGASDVALFNSGAAAMHSAIAAEGLKVGDVVFCADAIYDTTKKDIQSLEGLGIRVVIFDSTDLAALRELVEREKPRLIVVETVANSKGMEVTDLEGVGEIVQTTNLDYQENRTSEKILTKFCEKRKNLTGLSAETQAIILASIEEYRVGQNPFVFRKAVRCIEQDTELAREEVVRELERMVKRVTGDSREKLSVIIDNTLPSPVLINPLQVLKKFNVEKVIVESGTKHYQEGANEITLGVAYSDNDEKTRAIKTRRIELGTYLQPTDERKIPDSISETMAGKMKNHARNALQLAEALSGITGLEVSHPNLPTHKQNELVQELAPEGAVTLFYVTVPEKITGEQFIQRVKDLAGESVGLGSSFGHEKTWLSNYGMDKRTVRIAAGIESEQDFSNIVHIFKQVAIELI
ncbi:MAG: PLP-dependent transferase [Patescibacteria group bacterium]|jgi:cystathionine beta-lyase/cystathionine gamma-synthase